VSGHDDDRDHSSRFDAKAFAVELASTGAEVAVAATGGPIGLAAPLAGLGLRLFLQQIAARFVTQDERWRIGKTMQVAAADFERREADGQDVRDDGFFDEDGQLRPEGLRLLEGILRQAAESWDERKLDVLGDLYSGIAHDASISADDATYMLRVAGELTYRQIEALAVFARWKDHQDELVRLEGLREAGMFEPTDSVESELDDLGDRRLLGLWHSSTGVMPFYATLHSSAPPSRQAYSNLRLTTLGETFARLAALDRVPQVQRERWIEDFKGDGEPSW
jgi:hypothetical protein